MRELFKFKLTNINYNTLIMNKTLAIYLLLSCIVISPQVVARNFHNQMEVKSDMENKPLTAKKVYFALVAETGKENFGKGKYYELHLRFFSQVGSPMILEKNKSLVEYSGNPNKTPTPTLAVWEVEDSQKRVKTKYWISLVKNRGIELHNEMLFESLQDIENSYLTVYYEDLDGDGKRDDLAFVFKISEFVKQIDYWIPKDSRKR